MCEVCVCGCLLLHIPPLYVSMFVQRVLQMAHKTADCNEATETKIVVMVNRGGMERREREENKTRE